MKKVFGELADFHSQLEILKQLQNDGVVVQGDLPFLDGNGLPRFARNDKTYPSLRGTK